MGFGSTVKPGMDHGGASVQQVAAGSVKSDWTAANTSLQTVNTDALLNIGTSTDYTTVSPIEVPDGATRVFLRGAVSTDATAFTTAPVVVLVGVDKNGIPQRVDDPDDSNGTGITLTFTGAGVFTADSMYWTEVTSDFDCLGYETIYVLVSTAASITDGSTQQAATAYVRFTN
eukprot:GHVO01018897.1.p2 GENE.GHVO01018897.1~~GHVO01018897.1.p2  ORF type:complete len:173 (-),score=28.94 GHVO01018897.1:233-751(-)